jgi:hypothetical protein
MQWLKTRATEFLLLLMESMGYAVKMDGGWNWLRIVFRY